MEASNITVTNSKVKPVKLLPNLWCIVNDPDEDKFATRSHLQVSSYLLKEGSKGILVDVASQSLMGPVAELCEQEGVRPVANLLTHRHVVGKGGGVRSFVQHFPGVPLFLHPLDAASESGHNAGVHFEDPTASKLLADLGIRCWVFPGHTAGSVQYYSDREGGILFLGDTAVGAPSTRNDPGRDHLVRPISQLNEDDAELRENWRKLLTSDTTPEFRTIGCLHGKVYVKESKERVHQITKSLYEMETSNSF